MDLLLPDGLKALIRDRYLAGVSDALAKYPFSAADEDSLTGALGNSISMPQAVVFGDGQRDIPIKFHIVRFVDGGRARPKNN